MKTSLALLIGALLLGGATAGGRAQQITTLSTASSLVPQGVTLLSRTAPLVLRVRGSLVRGVGPRMTVRLNGQPLGTVAVDHTDWRDHAFTVPALLASGTTLEIVFDNDAAAAGDVTTVPYKQIIIAMGEGAKASLGAFDHLIRSSVTG